MAINKKLVGIGALIIFGLLALAVPLLFRSGVVTYSDMKDVTLEGYVSEPRMHVKIPVEMKEVKRSQDKVTFELPKNPEDPSQGNFGKMSVATQTLGISSMTQVRKNTLAETFASEAFEQEVYKYLSNLSVTDLNVVSKGSSDDNSRFQWELTGKIDTGGGTSVPARSLVRIYIENRAMYILALALTDNVYRANTGFISELEESVRFEQKAENKNS